VCEERPQCCRYSLDRGDAVAQMRPGVLGCGACESGDRGQLPLELGGGYDGSQVVEQRVLSVPGWPGPGPDEPGDRGGLQRSALQAELVGVGDRGAAAGQVCG
jgi:hypothetical protein